MKKLLLILLCLPMIGFGQGCHYGNSTDASELCDFYRGNSFATYNNADIALDKILHVTGMSKRFVLKECNDISNCVATAYKGIRYILYDRSFMDAIATKTNSWSNISILAHEIGHHVNGHSLDLIIYANEAAEAPTLAESRQMELEADEYSGFVMFKLGASLSQAQEAVRLVATNKDDSYSTHPSLDKRLKAIETGYNKAKSQDSNNNYSINKSSSANENTAMDLAYLSMDLFSEADNAAEYGTELIQEFAVALETQLEAMISEYNDMVYDYNNNEYSEIDELDLDNFDVRIEVFRKNAQEALKEKEIEIFDPIMEMYVQGLENINNAIAIDPNNSAFFRLRGIVHENLSEDFCDDYKKACDLEDNEACDWYNNQCE